MTKWRIGFRSRITGLECYGSPIGRDEADWYMREFSKVWLEIEHWIEPVR